MKVIHITPDMAIRTTMVLLSTLPEELRKDRKQHPPLIAEWVELATTELGYRWREDLGGLMRGV